MEKHACMLSERMFKSRWHLGIVVHDKYEVTITPAPIALLAVHLLWGMVGCRFDPWPQYSIVGEVACT